MQPITCLFGPPGSGKTTVARALGEALGIVHIEFDSLVPADILDQLHRGVAATDEDRVRAMANGIAYTRSVVDELRGAPMTGIIVSCGLRTAAMRRQFLEAFPQARLVLLRVDDSTRVERMLARETAGHLLTTEVRQRLESLPERRFEPVEEPHDVVDATPPAHEVARRIARLLRAEPAATTMAEL